MSNRGWLAGIAIGLALLLGVGYFFSIPVRETDPSTKTESSSLQVGIGDNFEVNFDSTGWVSFTVTDVTNPTFSTNIEINVTTTDAGWTVTRHYDGKRIFFVRRVDEKTIFIYGTFSANFRR